MISQDFLVWSVLLLGLMFTLHQYALVGWTKTEAIDSLMRKAGYNGDITEALRKRIRLTRYQSTLYSMHYSDYVSYVRETRGAAPSIVGAKPADHWFFQAAFSKTRKLVWSKTKNCLKETTSSSGLELDLLVVYVFILLLLLF